MIILGFDPGRLTQFAWCVASGTINGQLQPRYHGSESHAAGAVSAALEKARKCGEVEAAAIDSPLFWGPNGDRNADKTVRDAMRHRGAANVGGTVQNVNCEFQKKMQLTKEDATAQVARIRAGLPKCLAAPTIYLMIH